jgi:hypothetical protein
VFVVVAHDPSSSGEERRKRAIFTVLVRVCGKVKFSASPNGMRQALQGYEIPIQASKLTKLNTTRDLH